MARSDPAPALRLWLTHVSRALPPHHPRTERSLSSAAYVLHALQGPFPRLVSVEDILMGCFLHWTATTCTTGAQHRTLKERPILSGYRWQF